MARALALAELPDALADTDRAILNYVAKLTLSPSEMTNDDVSTLHAAGLTDAQVWEATFTAAIFAMFNRMADAFGLEPTDGAIAALER